VLAETLHFGRAAERLHVTTSALSQSVRRLEREVGTPLLVRSTRHVALTAAGAALLARAAAVQDAADGALTAARDAARAEAGSVAAGGFDVVADTVPRLAGRPARSLADLVAEDPDRWRRRAPTT